MVVFIVFIWLGVVVVRFYRVEVRSERIFLNLVNMVKVIFEIYFVLMFVGVYLYYINGMGFFDVFIYFMIGFGIGGMSIYDESIGFFYSLVINVVMIFFMIMGVVNFIVYYRVFKDRFFKLFFVDI